VIIKNAARCKKCGDVIESTFRHDWVSCKCGAIFVDGGHAYLHYGFDKIENFEDLSVVKKDKKDEG
jgi:hypothetical protein